MQEPIRLHSVAGSRSFRVLWLLYEMGLEPEVISYDLAKGELRKPDFQGLSPAGRVPVLEIDGQVLFESGAITEYLCETRSEKGLAPMPGEDERAQYLTWLHYAETIGVLIQNLNLQQVFLPDPAMRSPTVIGIEVKRLAVSLKPLERILAEQDFLLRRGFSAADTMMGFTLESARHYVRFDRFPKLSDYKARIEARPAYQRALEAEGLQQFYDREFYEVPEG
ncbi:glutathione S-transferase family protein [Aquicoccus porphyridii]|uniref:Glutathione S-transferase family protein n=1 Tax=Aquicoccus porphyridii TaxID=1852029 RepID=A0A5A9ZBW1_9RHOB|nr:glutathione S-transferase family protein [Aquicoccus porphyridii]KAA0914738.1 glutathione S-transferase family protein [Aquicoccus porphyridii]RAI53420.1 glutathione S-transferase [Rhodobacteraceae bacterium AsT-22]